MASIFDQMVKLSINNLLQAENMKATLKTMLHMAKEHFGGLMELYIQEIGKKVFSMVLFVIRVKFTYQVLGQKFLRMEKLKDKVNGQMVDGSDGCMRNEINLITILYQFINL